MIEPCNPPASLDPSINQQFQRALALYHQGQRAEAQSRLRRVIAADPKHRESLHLMAIIAAQERKFVAALDLFERALAVDPNNAALHADRGLVLRQLGQFDDALTSYDRALALDPRLALVHLNRGAVLKELERWHEALASYDRMLAIQPGNAEAHYNRANLLQQLGRFDAALAGYQRAIACKPDYTAAHSNRGGVFRQLGRWDEAEASYTQAIAMDPGDAGAYFNRAIVRLTKGDFNCGLADYEWRFRDPNCPSFKELRNFPQSRWTGVEPAAGRSIFLHCEQGYGDVIQFCRYASLLKDLGAHAILEVPRPLLGLLASLQGIFRLVPKGEPPPAFDYHSPLLSLPLAMNTTLDNIPSPGKYLSGNPSKVEQWRRRLGDRSMPRVGLVWSGNASFIDENRRRIPLEKLLQHLPPGIEYFRLQKDLRESDRAILNTNSQLRDFTSELADFEDTAALCECMDLVVSTCTSVAHLSSALGKRTWILLAHIADWRWFLDRDDTPWYASARLYRQSSNGDWDGVLRRVANDLEKIRDQAGGRDTDLAQLSLKFKEAKSLHQRGRLAQAQSLYEEILRIEPRHFDALLMLGMIAGQAGNFARSVELTNQALKINPNDAAAHNNRGLALKGLKQFDAALLSYEHAVALQADFAEAHSNRGNLLRELHDLAGALASYDNAIAVRPDHAHSHYNRGVVLAELERWDEALSSYDRAIAIKPEYAQAHSNRGNVLRQFNRLDEALASCKRAVALEPDFAEAHSNLGNVFVDLRQFDAAAAHYDRAIALNPDFAEAYFNRSFARLAQGDFAGGWVDFEWRSRIASITTGRDLSRPLWLGQHSIAQKTILLHSEYGLGDTLHFCRYVPLVAELGARVVLEVQAPLAGLLASLEGVAQLVTTGMNLPQFDYHCPLMSLPLAFKTRLGTIPATIPYLSCDASKVEDWRSKLGSAKRVGLAWSGNPRQNNDRHRSIALAALIEHLPADLQYVSLQKDLRETDERTLASYPQILWVADSLKDFSDTAALCECLDMVICVDTSIAHLAGGLGKETWILLPFNSDWRWLVDRHDSPWYPTAKLYRQRQMGDWRDVLDQVRVDLIERFKSVVGIWN